VNPQQICEYFPSSKTCAMQVVNYWCLCVFICIVIVMAHKKVYDENFEDLTKILPMNDSIFTAKLKTKGLLEGDISEQIETKATKADKAKYFLRNVIESGLDVDDTENFDKFLNVMEKSEHRLLVKRANKMRSELSGI